ncbi:TonB-dependent receptor [Flavobacterium sp. FPG59]|uniref:TonB-dependent receptor n=1 Tax=Flavobacterium sp. FPG59 TaxID=1929267 RepID=UPI0020CD8C52|nr:TonB-dependent receptor [Flavobacterium sp. FPG59]
MTLNPSIINVQNHSKTGILKPFLLGFLFMGIIPISWSQKKEQIGTETVNVVKPFTPKISDAFKVKEVPELEEEANSKKETVKYAIFSFSVASTFTPSKGKAQGVEKEKQPHIFKNYATFGAGNYGTLVGELFVNHDLNATDYVGGMFRHHSSQGGINTIDLDNNFYDTAFDIMYGSNQKTLSYNLDLGYNNQIYNWYGLPMNFGNSLTNSDKASLLASIDPKQAYNTLSFSGNVVLTEGILDKATVKFNRFTDLYKSVENRFVIKPTLELKVMDYAVKTDVIVDYLGGNFVTNNSNTAAIDYGFTNFGLSPSFVMQEKDWTLNLGATLYYSLDTKNSNSSLYIYPKFTASYKVVGDLMIFYAGAEGNLNQNSYQDFVTENPFLSPTLLINPTDNQYEIYAGLKGKLSNTVSYTLRGSYNNERNKALFKSNDYSETATNMNYGFGNSFQVVYDDMRTLRFFGELKADFSKDVSFGINGSFSSFTNDFQQEAWNLPAIQFKANLDVDITEKWYAGANVFYVGERKDLQNSTTFLPSTTPIILEGYFDLNANVGYKYNEQLTGFIKLNNLTNNNYQKWLNFPVQGFQFLVGANYKFDF